MIEQIVPPRVQALAKQANGVALAWKETDTSIVIVFVDGRKLTFDVEQVIEMPVETAAENIPPVSVPNQHQKKGKGK